MKKHLLALLTPLLVISCLNGQSAKFKNIKATEFQGKIADGQIIILDVRTPGEVAEGIIPGALHLDIYDENFDRKILELDQKKPVYVYCKSGGRSARAAGKLIKAGFPEVYNLEGGITAWSGAGFKIEKQK